jgi:MoaA/NifB/PqqE/SkfB family radical SAM enzyme
MDKFKMIFYEISGVCNAKCPYCLNGRYKRNSGEFVSPELFDKTLRVIKENQLLGEGGFIGLYNWGEPFLHPRLGELLRIINDYGLGYSFSTNASKIPSIDRNFVSGLRLIDFSLPGFSQAAYDRIHGFDFKIIIANIKEIVRQCRYHGYRGRFYLSFHVYQFNLEEMRACESFANRLGIIFAPYFAILNNWYHINAYLDNRLDDGLLKKVSQDLFLFDLDKKIATSPQNYRCPQYEILAIDETSRVQLCCQVPKDDGFYCGDLLSNSLSQIVENRLKSSVCRDCLARGLAFYFNTSLSYPRFYSKTFKQRWMSLGMKYGQVMRVFKPGV